MLSFTARVRGTVGNIWCVSSALWPGTHYPDIAQLATEGDKEHFYDVQSVGVYSDYSALCSLMVMAWQLTFSMILIHISLFPGTCLFLPPHLESVDKTCGEWDIVATRHTQATARAYTLLRLIKCIDRSYPWQKVCQRQQSVECRGHNNIRVSEGSRAVARRKNTHIYIFRCSSARLLLVFLTPKRNEWGFNWFGHFLGVFFSSSLVYYHQRKTQVAVCVSLGL